MGKGWSARRGREGGRAGRASCIWETGGDVEEEGRWRRSEAQTEQDKSAGRLKPGKNRAECHRKEEVEEGGEGGSVRARAVLKHPQDILLSSSCLSPRGPGRFITVRGKRLCAPLEAPWAVRLREKLDNGSARKVGAGPCSARVLGNGGSLGTA